MKRFALITATIMPMLGFLSAQSINPACAPKSGLTLKGSPSCSCDSTTGTVTCSQFQICGVGNFDADVALSSQYSATVTCTNNGGQVVEVKTHEVNQNVGEPATQIKNGCLLVPEQQTVAPTTPQLLAAATCPNGNWTPKIKEGTTATLDGFTYTVTFDGLSGCPYITINSCS
ncbi:hypothetical protein FOMG_18258 [Fusarium oxysporum f. sp. melonis 26406]|uniref:Secreted protein n=1 Tax=Fusarium oxysporum f. sp. melonis 26406 TaxID=1089452 RepID=W9Z9Y4_FUSOX|nr:hypothetical protein FOMG_18258 [Fusarium oxysporum f. sp. melonis 26406]